MNLKTIKLNGLSPFVLNATGRSMKIIAIYGILKITERCTFKWNSPVAELVIR